MGFNPFKILGGAAKGAFGVVKKVAPIAAGVGATILTGGAGAVATGLAATLAQRQGSSGAGVAGSTGIVAQRGPASRKIPTNAEEALRFTASAGGPSFNPSTQQTQPFESVLDKLRNDLGNLVSGVAQSFGRDVARGAAQGADTEGGIPISVSSPFPILLVVGGLVTAGVVTAFVLTRK